MPNTTADKYAAYLKGFNLLNLKDGRTKYRFSETFGAGIKFNPKKSIYQLVIWGGFKDLFKSEYVVPLYNEEQNAFALLPADQGLKVNCYDSRGPALYVVNKPLAELIYTYFKLTGISTRLRTKRIGELLFLFPPETPV